jgi:hypothetical protein
MALVTIMKLFIVLILLCGSLYAADTVGPSVPDWAQMMAIKLASDTNTSNYKPRDGYVPDAKAAIKIAVAVWEPIYGAEQIAREKPYQAYLTNGVWTVVGTLPPETSGGTAVAQIAKDDGKILRVTHFK